jgi:uncharacterized damage-inducible protein DinB
MSSVSEPRISLNLASFYDGWGQWNSILVDAIRNLSAEQLELRTAPHVWTIWQIVGHLAGVRACWFHHLKNRTMKSTPFSERP